MSAFQNFLNLLTQQGSDIMIIDTTVSVYGTEVDFLEAVYDAFTQIDGVVMSPSKSNIASMFSDTSNTPTFTLTYNGVTIQFQREGAVSTFSTGYCITASNTTISQVVCSFGGFRPDWDDFTTRAWNIKLITASNALKLIISDDDRSDTYYYLFIFYPTGNTNTILYKKDTDVNSKISSLTLYPVGSGTSCKTVNALNYTVSGSGVDNLGFTILTTTTGVKFTVVNGLKSCTTVPVDTVLTISGKDHYSIGTDVIVEV